MLILIYISVFCLMLKKKLYRVKAPPSFESVGENAHDFFFITLPLRVTEEPILHGVCCFPMFCDMSFHTDFFRSFNF